MNARGGDSVGSRQERVLSRQWIARLVTLLVAVGTLATMLTPVAGAATTGELEVATTELPAAGQGQTYSTILRSEGATGSTRWSLLSGSLPAGLSLGSSGRLSGTPTGFGPTTFTVGVTDSAAPPRRASAELTLDIRAAPPLRVSGPPQVVATQGTPVTAQLDATGGTAPYRWSLPAGERPGGFQLGSAGRLSGTPSEAGLFELEVEVLDSSTPVPQAATATVVVRVEPGTPLEIAEQQLAPVRQGTNVNVSLAAEGGVLPTTWAVAAGALPPGLTLSASSGAIRGVPAQHGTFSFSVSATDAAAPVPKTALRAFTLEVTENPLTILTGSLPALTQGQNVFATLQRSGGAGSVRWSLVSGSLPAGVAMGVDGRLTGRPTGSGISTFSVAVEDSSVPPQSASATLSLNVLPTTVVSIGTGAVATGVVGQAYSQTIGAGNGVAPYTFAVTAGQLPAGLVLDAATGEITGRPTTAGSFTFTVTASDAATPAPTTAGVELTIPVSARQPLAIPPTLPNAVQGGGYTGFIFATGGAAPYTWEVDESTLPPGISVGRDGRFSGAPRAAGAFSVRFTVTDSSVPAPETTTGTVAWTVVPSAAPSITPINVGSLGQGQTVSATVSATGGVQPYIWSAAPGTLPPGLALTPGGQLSGVLRQAGSFTTELRVTDSSSPSPRVDTRTVVFDIAPAQPLAISATPPPTLQQGFAGSGQFGRSGGVEPFTFEVVSGALPDGLRIESNGRISGTATGSGVSAFELRVTDSALPTPNVATRGFTWEITSRVLAISTTSVPQPTQGRSYQAQINTTGGAGARTWTISEGELPPGLLLDARQGRLTGTPTLPGTFAVTVTATDSSTPIPQTAAWSTVLDVAANPPSLTINTTSLPGAVQGDPYSAYLSSSGGEGTARWTIASGELPEGLTLSTSGSISGRARTPGHSMFVARVESTGPSGTWSATTLLSIVVLDAPPLAMRPSAVTASQYRPVFGQLSPSGGVSPYTFALTSGSLPDGVTMSAEGQLEGTPTQTGLFDLWVTVTDSATPVPNTTMGSLQVSVAPLAPLAITTTSIPSARQGEPMSVPLAVGDAVGGTTWRVSAGALPSGVLLDTAGRVVGTPREAGTFVFTATAIDLDLRPGRPNLASASFSLLVEPAATLSARSPDGARVGASYFSSPILGGVGPYSVELLAGALPPGLSMSAAGAISGRPTAAGSYEATFRVTDSALPVPQSIDVPLTMVVAPSSPLGISSAGLAPATKGASYSHWFSATGGVGPYRFTLEAGDLPAGLRLSSDGRVTGAPTIEGSFEFTIAVTDSGSPAPTTTTRLVSLDVVPPAPLTVTTTSLGDAQEGVSCGCGSLTATGGIGSQSWSLVAGTLPRGITLTSSGFLSGTPRSVGSHAFTVRVVDSTAPLPRSAIATVSLAVRPGGDLSIQTTSVPDGRTGADYTWDLRASGGSAPYEWAVFSGALPEGLEFSSDAQNVGRIAGSPRVPGSSTFTVIVRDSGSPEPRTAAITYTINVAAGDSLHVPDADLPDATVGHTYEAGLSAQGGVAPYSWVLAGGVLPAGLTFDAVSGTIVGTPLEAGSASLLLTVTDSAEPRPTSVAVPVQVDVGPAAALTITSPSLRAATAGVAYSERLYAAGGRPGYRWSVRDGDLPAGLTLSAEGVLSGAATEVGSSMIDVEVEDASNPRATAERTFTLVVTPPNPVSISRLPTGTATIGRSYSSAVAAAGGIGPFSWALASGSLPDGLTVTANGTVVGTPNAIGTSTFALRGTDSATPSATITVEGSIQVVPVPPLAVTGPTVVELVEGQPTSTAFSASGGQSPYRWAVAAGPLPTGLTMSTWGSLTGTPRTTGPHPVTIEVTDSSSPPNVATLALTIGVTPSGRLAVETASLPNPTQGAALPTTMLAASGGIAPYTWSAIAATIPPGLSVSTSGALTGTPTQAGTWRLAVVVTDSATPVPATSTATFPMTIGSSTPLAITPRNLAPLTVGQPIPTQPPVQLQATGGVAPRKWSVSSGALPQGLALSDDGRITGQPTVAGTFVATATVTDAATPDRAAASSPLRIVVEPSTELRARSTALPRPSQGDSYSARLAAVGGIQPYRWVLAAGALPDGLTLDADGRVSGVPTAAGRHTFSARVADTAEPSASSTTSTLTLDVVPATPPVVVTTAVGSPVQGEPGTSYLAASGGLAPYTWSLRSGALPAGLTLSPTGALSGTPTVAGTFEVTVGLTDRATPFPNEATGTVRITVAPARAVEVVTSQLDPWTQGSYAIRSLSAAGGVKPYSWSLSSGDLPAGLTLSEFGSISGEPRAAGTFPVVLAVTDATKSSTLTKALAVEVAPAGNLAVATSSLPDASQGTSYGVTLQAANPVGTLTWSVESGDLPTGLRLTASGVLTGRPRVRGDFDIVVSVTDSAQPASRRATAPLRLKVTSPPDLRPVPVAPVELRKGRTASWCATATGGLAPYSWRIARGQLPPGLRLTANGCLSGAASSTGDSEVTLTVVDSAPLPAEAELDLVVRVLPPLPIEIPELALSGRVGEYAWTYLTATGGTGAVSWAVTAGSLPAGLTLSSGVIQGVPTVAGTSTLTVTATDLGEPGLTASREVTVVVAPAAPPPPLAIATTQLSPAFVGVPYTQRIYSTGGTEPTSWTLTAGQLPAGLTLERTVLGWADIVGTPTATSQGDFSLTVTDSGSPPSSVSRRFTLPVMAPEELVVTPTELPTATAGASYSTWMSATGAFGSLGWELVSGALPPGLALDETGRISGVATAVASASFVVRATDTSTGRSATANMTLRVAAPATLEVPAPTWPAATAGRSFSRSLPATGGYGARTWTYSGGRIPPGMSLAASGTIAGVPRTAGTFTFSAVVTDSAQPVPSAVTATFTLEVGAGSALEVTTTALAPATAGAPYSARLTSSGGVEPVSWELVGGRLPDGLTLDARGLISGTAAEPGSARFHVAATDSDPAGAATTPKVVTLAVLAPEPLSVHAYNSSGVPGIAPAVVGQAYVAYFVGSGGTAPYEFRVSSGSLPTGLELDPSPGAPGAAALLGVPLAAGTFSFTLTVSDSSAASANLPLTVTVAGPDPLAVVTSEAPDARQGYDYFQPVFTSGGTGPVRWSVDSGQLPPGLALATEADEEYSYSSISGTPTTPGSYTFVLRATDSASPPVAVTSAPMTIEVVAAPIEIRTTTLGPATVGNEYGASLLAVGGRPTLRWIVESGALPPGLRLSSDGTISGRPTKAGSYSFYGNVRDTSTPSVSVRTARLTITVTPPQPLRATTTWLQPGVIGTPYYGWLDATGGAAPYTWAVTEGALPPGLRLESTAYGWAVTGSPTTHGTFPVTLTLSDATAATVAVPTTVRINAPTLTVDAVLPDAIAGRPYAGVPTPTGGAAPFTWSLEDGQLPAGLELDPATGTVSGTPSAVGTSSFVLSVRDSQSPPASVTVGASIRVRPPTTPLEVASAISFSVRSGERLAELLSADGGTSPYSWSFVSGDLPPGVALDAVGALEGRPTAVGSYVATLRVTDGAVPLPAVATTTVTVEVAAAPANTSTTSSSTAATSTTSSTSAPQSTSTTLPSPLRIDTDDLPPLAAGEPFSTTFSATAGTAPLRWTVSRGQLPPAFTLDPDTGRLAGTATTGMASTPFTVKVTDARDLTATAAFTLALEQGPVKVATTALPDGVAGSEYQAFLGATGGHAPHHWEIVAGTLPVGVTLSPLGQIVGVPTRAGASTFSVRVSDGSRPSRTDVRELSITVGPAQPLQNVVGPRPGGTVGEPYYRQFLARGGLAPYTWSLASGQLPPGLVLSAFGTLTGTPTTVGSYEFDVVVVDSSDPVPSSVRVSSTLVVAPVGPRVALSATVRSGRGPLATSLLVSGAQPDGNPLSYTVDFGDGTAPESGTLPASGGSVALAHTYTEPGRYVAQVTAVDEITQLSASATEIVRVASSTNNEPVAVLEVAPASGVAPFATALRLSGSDADDDPMSYTLDFGDGSEPTGGRLRGSPLIRHTYARAGSYAATFTVSDGVLSDTSVVHVLVVQPTAVTANAGDDQVVTVGDRVQFNGTGSQPVGAIQRYSWAFGDGGSSSGSSPSHVYTAPGTYTAQLSVSVPGSTDTDTATITVAPPRPEVGLRVGVVADGVALEGAQLVVVQANGVKVSAVTDGSGVGTLRGLPDGEVAVNAYKPGYKPQVVTTTVAGGVGEAVVTLTPGPVASVSMTSKPMTISEIQAAGIDVNDPNNRNVVLVEANLNFTTIIGGGGGSTTTTFRFSAPLCGEVFCGNVVGGGGGGGSWNGHSICDSYRCATPVVGSDRDRKWVQWLVIPIEASWLKEFFEVEMLITNLSDPGFVLDNGVASLELPAGLSLADTREPQSITRPVPDLDGGQSHRARWIVRGDAEGSYALASNYSALLQPFEAPISIRAESRNPVKVWGGSALEMTIEAEAAVSRLAPYKVRVGLENVSDKPVYNAALELKNEGRYGYIPQPLERYSQGTPVIAPGQTFWADYVLAPWIWHSGLRLEDSFVKKVSGNVSIAAKITSVPVPTSRPSADVDVWNKQAKVTFAPIPGAVGYDVFLTTDVNTEQGMQPNVLFGDVPAASVDGPAPDKVVLGEDAYKDMTTVAISTRFPGGRREMIHPMQIIPDDRYRPAIGANGEEMYAAFAVPIDGEGRTIRFNASAALDDAWDGAHFDFGDGTRVFASDGQIDHEFPAGAAEYRVTVTAANNPADRFTAVIPMGAESTMSANCNSGASAAILAGGYYRLGTTQTVGRDGAGDPFAASNQEIAAGVLGGVDTGVQVLGQGGGAGGDLRYGLVVEDGVQITATPGSSAGKRLAMGTLLLRDLTNCIPGIASGPLLPLLAVEEIAKHAVEATVYPDDMMRHLGAGMELTGTAFADLGFGGRGNGPTSTIRLGVAGVDANFSAQMMAEINGTNDLEFSDAGVSFAIAGDAGVSGLARDAIEGLNTAVGGTGDCAECLNVGKLEMVIRVAHRDERGWVLEWGWAMGVGGAIGGGDISETLVSVPLGNVPALMREIAPDSFGTTWEALKAAIPGALRQRMVADLRSVLMPVGPLGGVHPVDPIVLGKDLVDAMFAAFETGKYGAVITRTDRHLNAVDFDLSSSFEVEGVGVGLPWGFGVAFEDAAVQNQWTWSRRPDGTVRPIREFGRDAVAADTPSERELFNPVLAEVEGAIGELWSAAIDRAKDLVKDVANRACDLSLVCTVGRQFNPEISFTAPESVLPPTMESVAYFPGDGSTPSGPRPLNGLDVVGAVFETSAPGTAAPQTFPGPAQVDVTYEEGFLGGADPSELALFRFVGGGWTRLDSSVDASTRSVSAETDRFGTYAIGRDPVAPEVLVRMPGDEMLSGNQRVGFSARVADAVTPVDELVVTVEVDGVAVDGVRPDASGLVEGTTPPLADGRHEIRFRVEDQSGNVTTRSIPIVVDTVAPDTPAAPTVSRGDRGVTLSFAEPGTYEIERTDLPGEPYPLQVVTGAEFLDATAFPEGSYRYRIRAVDGAMNASAWTDAVTIESAFSIETASLPDGEVAATYESAVRAKGGSSPITFSVTDGQLPPGIELDAVTGLLTGVPTASGRFGFTVLATDSSEPPLTVSRSFSILVAEDGPPLSIVTQSLPDGIAGSAYPTTTLETSGGVAPVVWAVTDGALPGGLVLDATSGAVTGTPTAAGTFDVEILATDSSTPPNVAVRRFTIVVGDVADPLTIVTRTLPSGGVGSPYQVTLESSGGISPVTWTLRTGELPAGLSIDPTGAIVGTPDESGTFTFSIAVTDSASPPREASLEFELVIEQPVVPLTIDTALLPDGTEGVAYPATTLTTSGGSGAISWAVDGSLPTGLVLDATTGTISGTPTSPGTFTFRVTATDAAAVPATATKEFTVEIAADVDPLQITTVELPAGTLGDDYESTLIATGGSPPVSWSISAGDLPPGLALDAVTGRLAGRPTDVGTFTFTVLATDAATVPASASKDFALVIGPADTETTLDATAAEIAVGTPVRYTAVVTAPVVPGGAVRFRDGDASIATCDGVRLTSSAPHTATCTVTPTNPGSLAVTAEYLGDERTNASTSSVLVTTVRPRLAITSAPRVTVTYGDRVTFTVRTEGMAPSLTSSRAWWQTGLPSGMSFRDNGDGTATISGIPRGLGWHTLTVDATNRADPPVSQLFAIQVKKRPVSRCGGYGWFELLFVCDWSR